MKSGLGGAFGSGRLFGPEMREDPYVVYDELRANDPVHRDEAIGGWVVTRYADVSLVLNDARFTSGRVVRARARFPTELQPLLEVLSGRMSEHDGVDHKRVRGLVHDAFVRTAAQAWEPRIRERVGELLDEPSRRGRAEFMAEVAVPLPLSIVLELVGIPSEDHARVKEWSDEFSNVALNLVAGLPPEDLRRGLESVLAFREFLADRIRIVEESPADDLLSALVEVEHEGIRLSRDELLSNVLLILAAGNETTTCLLGSSLALLLQHPDQLALLRDNPSLIPNAVEETLRYESPVQFLARVAAADVTLHGANIRSGDVIVAVLGSANRDPSQFEHADRFDVTRPHMQHLAFGHGQHFCVGAQLARLEARITLETLVSRFPGLELDGSPPLEHHDNLAIRCLRELPIRIAST